MKVLSWDVGIIHLAYCLMEKIDESWKIYYWGEINLAKDIQDMSLCQKCTKKGKYYVIDNHQKKNYCGIHIKKINIKLLVWEEYFSECEPGECCYSDKCKSKAKYNSSDNNIYCKTHSKALLKKKNNLLKIQQVKNKSAMKIPIDILRYNLVKELENRKFLLDTDCVLIENQPTLKNPKMKAISSTIYDYFLIRGIFDKVVTQSNIKLVKYMSPSNKLKLDNNNQIIKVTKEKHATNKYKLTKQLAIEYTRIILKDQLEWMKFYESNKKKDDLADCFLQGLYYINKNYNILHKEMTQIDNK